MGTRLLNEVFDKLFTVQMTLGDGEVWVFFCGGVFIVCTVMLMFSGVNLYGFYNDKVLFSTVKRMYLFAAIVIANLFGIFGGFKSDYVVTFNVVSVAITTVIMYFAVMYVVFVLVVNLLIGLVVWCLSGLFVAFVMRTVGFGHEYVAYVVATLVVLKLYGRIIIVGINNFFLSLASVRYFVVGRE